MGAPAIVLMHGLGGTQKAMAKVAAGLADWRVITMDLRSHGQSTRGPWTMDNVVADLDAVIGHFGMDRPYVGGHSLGGMVALQYAMAGRPIAGAINIDGWGPGIATRYVGADEAAVEAMLDRVAAGQMPALARLLMSRTRQSREGTTGEVMKLLDRADVVRWHEQIACPVLTFNATAPPPRAVRVFMGREMAKLQDAYRNGIRRDLAAVAQQHPNVTVVEVDATHGLIKTHAADVVSAIKAFHDRLTRLV